ncbi:hypothetical protein RvY_00306 [Ramazzottius varieornatus]|uniref:Uncharacterized protein n=1 Tax=Ramazzottius varieornatus TaxID=947166 RepID=A0A1D1UDA4_RAMVA|nr:hypothetical protein RvY_00306 [Ramazzottius varieornatus]
MKVLLPTTEPGHLVQLPAANARLELVPLRDWGPLLLQKLTAWFLTTEEALIGPRNAPPGYLKGHPTIHWKAYTTSGQKAMGVSLKVPKMTAMRLNRA